MTTNPQDTAYQAARDLVAHFKRNQNSMAMAYLELETLIEQAIIDACKRQDEYTRGEVERDYRRDLGLRVEIED